ncbi:MAG: YigZ family protein [Candidatus Cloacimonetes bacterium]|nr:YigZ family protein [Candidatus Cloacimonadota bacterium]
MKYTISQRSLYEEKIKKSLFIGVINRADTVISAKDFITEVSKAHPQANHHIPAFIVGLHSEICFSSDDREPAGTAGKPVLNMLHRHELTNVAMVIVRYFGGVKLGVKGLIAAYGLVAEKAILSACKEPILKYFHYHCSMKYDFYDIFLHQTHAMEVIIEQTEFCDDVRLNLKVPENSHTEFLCFLEPMIKQDKIEIID